MRRAGQDDRVSSAVSRRTQSFRARVDAWKSEQECFSGIREAGGGPLRRLAEGWLRPVTNRLMASGVRPILSRMSVGASLIHAQTEGMAAIGSDVATALGIPLVTTIHGLNTDPRFLHTPAQRARLRRSLGNSDRLILVGESLRAPFSNLAGRGDHIRIVSNGVCLPDAQRQTSLLESENLRLIAVANLHEGKGIDIALDALALLDKAGKTNWTFTIVGDGAERGSLEARARGLGLANRVSFVGALPPAGIQAGVLDGSLQYGTAFGGSKVCDPVVCTSTVISLQASGGGYVSHPD